MMLKINYKRNFHLKTRKTTNIVYFLNSSSHLVRYPVTSRQDRPHDTRRLTGDIMGLLLMRNQWKSDIGFNNAPWTNLICFLFMRIHAWRIGVLSSKLHPPGELFWAHWLEVIVLVHGMTQKKDNPISNYHCVTTWHTLLSITLKHRVSEPTETSLYSYFKTARTVSGRLT